MSNSTTVTRIFLILLCLTLVAPFFYGPDASKVYYLNILLEGILPIYLYIVLTYPNCRPSMKNPLTLSVLAFLTSSIVSAVLGVSPLRSIWGTIDRMGGVFNLSHFVLFYFYIHVLHHLGRT